MSNLQSAVSFSVTIQIEDFGGRFQLDLTENIPPQTENVTVSAHI